MCVCVCASPGVGGSALVMHGCVHLFDTGDASPPSPRPARRMRRRNSSIGAPGGDPAPARRTANGGRSTVQGAFEQGTEPTTEAGREQETFHCDPLPYTKAKAVRYVIVTVHYLSSCDFFAENF